MPCSGLGELGQEARSQLSFDSFLPSASHLCVLSPKPPWKLGFVPLLLREQMAKIKMPEGRRRELVWLRNTRASPVFLWLPLKPATLAHPFLPPGLPCYSPPVGTSFISASQTPRAWLEVTKTSTGKSSVAHGLIAWPSKLVRCPRVPLC